MSQFQTRQRQGVHIHVLPTTKFKVTNIAVSFHKPLTEQTATTTALLPYVLMRGSEQYPSSEKLMGALDDLYGASLHGFVGKRGERQLVEFSLQVTNERFLSSSEPILERAIRLMAGVIMKPRLVEGSFDNEVVRKEKELHEKRIDSLMDDKIAYAAERCLQEMCRDERFGVPRYGRKEDLPDIDGRSLYECYLNLLQTAPIHVFVIGQVDPDEVADLIEREFTLERGQTNAPPSAEIRYKPDSIREVVERMDINQGKLNIGFRTGTTHADDDYPAMIVYNAILGGFPHSKLFVNVREKASLAYYASSRLESLKGIMFIQSGIQIENFDKAVSIIKEQVDDMREGRISEQEIDWTKTGLINQYRQLQDQSGSLMDIYTNGVISGRMRSLDDMIQQVGSVTLDDVIALAGKVHMDTIYFLRDKEEVAHA